jgi:hypothetical protein
MIYAVHRYTRRTLDTGPLEAFPSVERASVALQLRARKQESGTYYVGQENSATPRPLVKFPLADLTGYLAVWRRRAGEDAPGPDDKPEELWRLTKNGAVVKEPYEGDGEAYALSMPQLTPEQRRAKALDALAEVPPVTDEYRADLDPMWKRVLRDLVQDEQVEDAIHRVMQVNWKADRR